MKPRIKLAPRQVSAYRWMCIGGARYGVGDTPQEAYDRWRYRVLAPARVTPT